MKLFINAGFGEKIGRQDIEWIKAFGFDGVRQDIPTNAPAEHIRLLIDEIYSAGLEACFVLLSTRVWDGERVVNGPVPHMLGEAVYWSEKAASIIRNAGLTDPVTVEIGNELSEDPHYSDVPRRYGIIITETARVLLSGASNVKIVAGSTAGPLTKARGDWAWRVFETIPVDIPIGLAVHPYRTHERPTDSFDKAFDWTMSLNPKSINITEIGWHTAPYRVKKCVLWSKEMQWADKDVADFAWKELTQWRLAGAEMLTWFQLNDGPDSRDHEHRFGIRELNGIPKKVTYSIADWIDAERARTRGQA